MASLLIDRIDELTLERLRLRAAEHGRSVEEEAGEIVKSAVSPRTGVPGKLGQRIRNRFEPLGGLELPELERDPVRDPPMFD